MDGYYVVPAGRLDRNETAREGCVREIEEEIGIMIKSEMLEVVQVIHRKTEKDERIDFFMTTKAYTGEIKNKGPHKCDDLRWFKIDALPDNLVDYVRVALEHYRQHILYSEFGYK